MVAAPTLIFDVFVRSASICGFLYSFKVLAHDCHSCTVVLHIIKLSTYLMRPSCVMFVPSPVANLSFHDWGWVALRAWKKSWSLKRITTIWQTSESLRAALLLFPRPCDLCAKSPPQISWPTQLVTCAYNFYRMVFRNRETYRCRWLLPPSVSFSARDIQTPPP